MNAQQKTLLIPTIVLHCVALVVLALCVLCFGAGAGMGESEFSPLDLAFLDSAFLGLLFFPAIYLVLFLRWGSEPSVSSSRFIIGCLVFAGGNLLIVFCSNF